MKYLKVVLASIGLIFVALLFLKCDKDDSFIGDEATTEISKADPTTEGNNLSFPVIWSDGYIKKLRQPPIDGQPMLKGEWSYVWGKNPTDPRDPIYCCKPNPLDSTLCEDGSIPGDGTSIVYKSYIQQVTGNIWQADNTESQEQVNVDFIDWSDNLETVNWSTRSLLNIEVTLFEQLSKPMIEYAMRYVTGWGGGDMCGFQTKLNGETVYGPGDMSTVYSHNARFTIQEINVDPGTIEPGDVKWVPGKGWQNIETSNKNVKLFKDPIFNMAVYEAGDGPLYFNGEVNTEGKLTYGYLWDVNNLNSGSGYYRLTFSFDRSGEVPLNTFFDDNTAIIDQMDKTKPIGGGTPVINVDYNLSYIDIKIL